MRSFPLVTAILVLQCISLAHGADDAAVQWPQFRGVNGSGVAASDARPPESFGPKENVRWSVEVPFSPSSPCVWGDRIFLTTYHEGELQTRCYDRGDGKLRWSRGIKPEGVEDFHRSDGSPAASTPATDGRRVVSYFGSFGVVCYDPEGKELWRYALPKAESYGQYGSGASPVIVGQTVYLNRDQYRYSSLIALDVETGVKRWETPRPDAGGSFGTPVLWRNAGTDEIVLGASARLKGYDAKTGAERWSIEGVTGLVCTTPVMAGEFLIFAASSNAVANAPLPSFEQFLKMFDKNGDGIVDFDEIPVERRDYWRGLDVNRDGRFTKEDWELAKVRNAPARNVLLAVKPGGTGDISQTHVAWQFGKGLPYVASPLFYDGRIYLVKDGGLMTSLDAKTGEPIYVQERLGTSGSYYASPVAAGGRIYVASVTGKLSVVRAGGTKPEVLHTIDFGERILATPAIVGDAIIVRSETRLWEFSAASPHAAVTK